MNDCKKKSKIFVKDDQQLLKCIVMTKLIKSWFVSRDIRQTFVEKDM